MITVSGVVAGAAVGGAFVAGVIAAVWVMRTIAWVVALDREEEEDV